MLQNDSPRAILIHLGGNDLTSVGNFGLIRIISDGIRYLFRTFPSTTIIWLDIFQRIVWDGANSIKSIEQKRKRINYIGHKLVSENSRGKHFSIDIDYKTRGFFRADGVHLSEVGLEFTLDALQEFLKQAAC